MDTLTFHFEVEEGFDAEALAATVAERLDEVEEVEQSEAEVEDERIGVVEAATERKSLPDADVAAAGGWRDTRALRLSYQQWDPVTVLRVVEAGG